MWCSADFSMWIGPEVECVGPAWPRPFLEWLTAEVSDADSPLWSSGWAWKGGDQGHTGPDLLRACLCERPRRQVGSLFSSERVETLLSEAHLLTLGLSWASISPSAWPTFGAIQAPWVWSIPAPTPSMLAPPPPVVTITDVPRCDRVSPQLPSPVWNFAFSGTCSRGSGRVPGLVAPGRWAVMLGGVLLDSCLGPAAAVGPAA